MTWPRAEVVATDDVDGNAAGQDCMDIQEQGELEGTHVQSQMDQVLQATQLSADAAGIAHGEGQDDDGK